MTTHKLQPDLSFARQFLRLVVGDSAAESAGPGLPTGVEMQRYLLGVLVAAIPCLLVGAFIFGAGLITNFLASFLTACTVELAFSAVRKIPAGGGALTFAVLLSLIVSPDVPAWMICAGTAFGVIIGKEIFGGTGHYLFNPVLVSAAFIFFSNPQHQDSASFANAFVLVKTNPIYFAICTTLCAGGLVAMILIKIRNWEILAGVFAGATATAAVVAGKLFLKADTLNYALYHAPVELLVANGFLFAICFVALDPATIPVNSNARICYGIFIGALGILIANFSKYPQLAGISAVLLGNMFSPLFDSIFNCDANPENKIMKDGKVYPVIFITVLGLLCAGVITLASEQWKGRISQNEKLARNAAIVAALGLVDDKAAPATTEKVAKVFAKQITVRTKNGLEVFTAKDNSGKLIGEAVAFETRGFKGPIRGVIAFDAARKKVLGMRIYKQTETPAYGGRIADRKLNWFRKFDNVDVLRRGKPGRFIRTRRRAGDNYIDALSKPTAAGTMGALDRALTKITEQYLAIYGEAKSSGRAMPVGGKKRRIFLRARA